MTKLPDRERVDLARAAFALHERGFSDEIVAWKLGVSRGNATNLIGYGRRLAAGQGVPLSGEPGGS